MTVPPVLAPLTFTSGTRAGMRAQANCLIQEGDHPLKMSWQKDGEPLETEKGDVWISQFDTFSSILVIEKAAARHSGNYTCLATNPAKTTATTTQLIVRGKFKFITTRKDRRTLGH